jgi:hypothetical protein
MKRAPKKPLDLEAAISALPDKQAKHNWTPEIDRMLLKWCPIKGVPAVAGILRIPRPTVDARYQKLKAEGK